MDREVIIRWTMASTWLALLSPMSLLHSVRSRPMIVHMEIRGRPQGLAAETVRPASRTELSFI